MIDAPDEPYRGDWFLRLLGAAAALTVIVFLSTVIWKATA